MKRHLTLSTMVGRGVELLVDAHGKVTAAFFNGSLIGRIDYE